MALWFILKLNIEGTALGYSPQCVRPGIATIPKDSKHHKTMKSPSARRGLPGIVTHARLGYGAFQGTICGHRTQTGSIAETRHMNSDSFHNATFTPEAMDEVIEHLGYSRHSRNMAYLKALLAHAGTEEGYGSQPMDSDRLVQAIWNTEDPGQLRSRRKNLSTIRSSVNRDLSRLYKDGNNPEGVTISPEHALVVSQEAKEALYAPFANHFTNANSPEIEKASALLDALAEMAEKGGPLLDSTEGLAEKLKRAVKALEKGGALPDLEEKEDPEEVSDEEIEEVEEAEDEETEILDEEDELEELPEEEFEEVEEDEDEELDILDEEDELEEIPDEEFEEVEEDEDEELDILDGEDELEEIPDEEFEEVEEDEDKELDILDEGDELEEIPDEEFEEVEEDEDEELDIVDEEDDLEEIPEDDIEEIEEAEDDELDIVDEDEDLEEIPEDDIEEVEEAEDDELDIVDEDEGLEEIPEDDIEEVEEAEDDELDIIDDDEDLQEISDDDIEEVEDVEDEDLEDTSPWAADEDPDAMQERADRFDALLNESERYYNRYIHIPTGRYPALDPVTGEETLADLEEFLAGKYPVTNALFEVFIGRTGYKTTAEERGFGAVYEPRLTRQSRGKGISLSTSKGLRLIRGANWYKPSGARSSVHTSAHHPVVQVSYEDAMAFASWSGKRLPTLAQWLATGGRTATPYPWGDAWGSHLCNTEEVGAGGTLPVDTFPKGASPFGVYDLMGNTMEWVSDLLPEKGGEPVKTAVGGSFLSDRTLTRQQFQILDTRFSSNVLGFRCIGW
ncbi:c-type lectin fold [Desulfoluna spongiiphila]|nr:c-type lectin fold [Desulfoluna spongiiphila]